MKNSFKIESVKVKVQNEKVTVVEVEVSDKFVPSIRCTGLGRAIKEEVDVNNAEFGFYLAKSRAVTKALTKLEKGYKKLLVMAERNLKMAKEVYDKRASDVAFSKKLTEKLLEAEARGELRLKKHSEDKPNQRPSVN